MQTGFYTVFGEKHVLEFMEYVIHRVKKQIQTDTSCIKSIILFIESIHDTSKALHKCQFAALKWISV